MTTSLDQQLQSQLNSMKAEGTAKQFNYMASPMDAAVKMEQAGEVMVLSSNNYLGLSNHPDVVEAGRAALTHYGAGPASVRFICGTYDIHRDLEQAIARLHKKEASLSYVACWNANTGLIPTLAQKEDVLISDSLNHASLIDACRLSKARRMIYAHSDMEALENCLKEAQGGRQIFIITDGVFSMEGDIAKLPEIVKLARQYNASIIMDDCHGVGVMGKTGRGTAEHFDVEDDIDIITGTLGKALGGAAGGYVAASQPVIDYLNQTSRPQLFSNALPPALAASAMKAIEILESEPERVTKLHALVARMRDGLKARGFAPLEGPSAIVPIIVGETSFAIEMSKELLKEGIFITGFGYPVVPEGEARLRIQVSAALSNEQIDEALEKFEKVGKKLGVLKAAA
jgi:glycine C-acetyltransferase